MLCYDHPTHLKECWSQVWIRRARARFWGGLSSNALDDGNLARDACSKWTWSTILQRLVVAWQRSTWLEGIRIRHRWGWIVIWFFLLEINANNHYVFPGLWYHQWWEHWWWEHWWALPVTAWNHQQACESSLVFPSLWGIIWKAEGKLRNKKYIPPSGGIKSLTIL